MEDNKKYQSFSELYKDYGDIIDAEFEQRHLFRLKELLTSVENRQKWASKQISGFNNGQVNNYWREKIELYDEVYQTIMKELHLRLPSGEYAGMIDNKIKQLKNKIVNTIFSGGSLDRYRGTPYYNTILFKAGKIADMFENCMKAAFYDSKRHNFDIIDDEITKKFIESMNKRKIDLETKYYTKSISDFNKFLEEFSKMTDKEQLTIIDDITNKLE